MGGKRRKEVGICMVVGAYYPEGFGGSHQCRTLIQSLNGRFRIYVLTTSLSPRRFKEYATVDGVEVFRVRIWRSFILNLLCSVPQMIWTFLRLSSRIQIVHCHGVTSKNYLIVLLAKLLGKKVIQKFTSLGFDDPLTLQANLDRRRFLGRIAKTNLLLCDCFVAITPAFLESARNSFLCKKRIAEIPNGVNLHRFRPIKSALEKEDIREKLKISSKVKLILFIGFFSREKGATDLFAAWRRIKEKIDPSFLVLVGSTDSRYKEILPELVKGIQETIQKEKLGSEVLVREKVEEIEDYYRMADLFVLSSYREGLPNVLLEAMACGIPVIASRLPGIAGGVVEDGKSGWLFTPGDITELSEKILAVFTNPPLAFSLGRQARNHVEQRYDIQKIAGRYADLYTELG